jgi:2-polyprenyl-6-hydroxyphenyl methylase/3-demethylubiquinone-9 3-methyltransferase
MNQPLEHSPNINTPEYWDRVYREEWENGRVLSTEYSRDYGPIHDAIIELIPRDGARLVDVACGSGLLCRKIRQRRPTSSVVGVDFSGYTIARNRERDSALGIDYRCLDIRTSLNSVVGPFDVVAMCEILEHLERPETVVAAAMGLLRPGGRFILTCPHNDEIPDPEHLRIWGHDELFHLLAPYGDTVSFRHFRPPYFHVWMLAHLIKVSVGRSEGGDS